MPGLVGIVWNNRVDELLLDKMANSIRHEDWYKVDKYTDSFFRAARVSLGIFNPEPQPIFNENRTICIFMYGKIYNYEREVNELKNRGHKFTIYNDAEFCLHSYEEYGKDFVNSLNGSFVLAIYDLKHREIIIANDRYGLRPLYYAMNSGKLLFASEVKAILEDSRFSKELNDETIAEFFAFQGEIVSNKTFFKGIEVLPPASVFTYDGSSISIEKYWDFNYKPDYSLSEDEITDRLVQTFKEAVDIRMKDNLRYGVALSGGLDSRSIVGAMNKDRRQDLVTVTFGIRGCDEAKIAEDISRKADMRHMFVEIDSDEVITPYSEHGVFITDGMNCIGAGSLLFAYKKVKPHIDVLFDGLMGNVLPGGSELTRGAFRIKNNEGLAKILHARRVFPDNVLARLFTADYYAKIKDVPRRSIEDYLVKLAGHPANRLSYFTLQSFVRRFSYLGDVIMRSVVEEATPFFDNNFIDVIIKIPPALRFNHYIYRKFLIKLAPEFATIPYNLTMVRADAPLLAWKMGRIYQGGKEKLKKKILHLTRGKIYLPSKRSYVKLDEWMRLNEKWRGFVRGLLLDEEACSRSYFNKDYIETLIKQHEAGKADHSQRLAYLATFELFLRMFASSQL
jgi:asparagine synthase (glutamine-hydrolysing)